MDEATRDLLRAIQTAVRDSPDWKASAVWNAITTALEQNDPAAAAAWLRQFLRMPPAEQHQHLYTDRGKRLT